MICQQFKEELPTVDTTGKQKTLNNLDGLEGLPRCVEGLYCNASEVASFIVDRFDIRTNTINLHIKTKAILFKESKND